MNNFIICSITKYYYGDQSKRTRWAGHVAHIGERRYTYILVRRRDGKISLWRRGHRCEDNIKVDP
jgi:hypothetical protein